MLSIAQPSQLAFDGCIKVNSKILNFEDRKFLSFETTQIRAFDENKRKKNNAMEKQVALKMKLTTSLSGVVHYMHVEH